MLGDGVEFLLLPVVEQRTVADEALVVFVHHHALFICQMSLIGMLPDISDTFKQVPVEHYLVRMFHQAWHLPLGYGVQFVCGECIEEIAHHRRHRLECPTSLLKGENRIVKSGFVLASGDAGYFIHLFIHPGLDCRLIMLISYFVKGKCRVRCPEVTAQERVGVTQHDTSTFLDANIIPHAPHCDNCVQ